MKSEYHKIFWKTGQEITPETFIQADHYICAQQNLIRKFLNRQCYGLLPAGESGVPSFTVNANMQGGPFVSNNSIVARLQKRGI